MDGKSAFDLRGSLQPKPNTVDPSDIEWDGKWAIVDGIRYKYTPNYDDVSGDNVMSFELRDPTDDDYGDVPIKPYWEKDNRLVFNKPTPDHNYEIGMGAAKDTGVPFHVIFDKDLNKDEFLLMNHKAIMRFTHLDVRERECNDHWHETSDGYAWVVE